MQEKGAGASLQAFPQIEVGQGEGAIRGKKAGDAADTPDNLGPASAIAAIVIMRLCSVSVLVPYAPLRDLVSLESLAYHQAGKPDVRKNLCQILAWFRFLSLCPASASSGSLGKSLTEQAFQI